MRELLEEEGVLRSWECGYWDLGGKKKVQLSVGQSGALLSAPIP